MSERRPESRTAWIVDDVPRDADRASRALSAVYDVSVFHDSAEVLEALTSRTAPDVLVLDWLMPGLSGLELCQFLRSPSSPAPRISILLLTAQNQTEQLVQGLASGADDFLSKPYADAELRARVDSLVRQRALRERAERAETALRRLLVTSPDALVSVDDGLRVRFVNAAAEDVLGVTAAEAIGRPVSELLPTLAIPAGHERSGSDVLRGPDVVVGDQSYAPTFRRLPDDGSERLTIALRNVTDQRRAEARRLDFYSMIAHDLRTPLSAILLRSELIIDGGRGMLSAEVMNDMRRIHKNIRELVTMINDFLEIARYEGGEQQIERAPVDLASLAQEIVEDFRPLGEASRLQLSARVPDRQVVVSGERRRLAQVLSNLLSNAIKFTSEGGVVEVAVVPNGTQVEASVRDTGRGISRDAIPTIFERYSRAIDADHEVVGSGLGLMIVRQTIEAHGGTVGVESRPREGSRFWFRLPLAPSAALP